MQINLIDPGLVEPGGHHADWNLRIARHLAQALGHTVTIYANQAVWPETRALLDAHAEVHPWFSFSPYARAQGDDPVEREKTLFRIGYARLRAELPTTRPADLWLIPTAFPALLAAVAAVRPDCPISACLHRETGRPGQMLESMILRDAARLARTSGLEIHYSATTPELVAALQPVVEAPVAVLPIIYAAAPRARPAGPPRRVGFFGHHRPEKGTRRIVPITRQLLENGFQVTLHDSQGAFAKLAGAHPNLQILGRVDELNPVIAACDLVVVPYDANQYRYRMSGIVVEALAAGVPVVAPAATAPASLAQAFAACAPFAGAGEAAIMTAIKSALTGYPALAAGAEQARQRIRDEHGCARFIEALLPVTPALTVDQRCRQ